MGNPVMEQLRQKGALLVLCVDTSVLVALCINEAKAAAVLK